MSTTDINSRYIQLTAKIAELRQEHSSLLKEKDGEIAKFKSTHMYVIDKQKFIIKNLESMVQDKRNGDMLLSDHKLKHENWVLKQEIKKLHEKNRKLISQLVEVVNESKQGNVEFNYVNGNIEKVYHDHIQESIPVTKKTNRKHNDKELQIISENSRFESVANTYQNEKKDAPQHTAAAHINTDALIKKSPINCKQNRNTNQQLRGIAMMQQADNLREKNGYDQVVIEVI
jgi:hypothetical protein